MAADRWSTSVETGAGSVVVTTSAPEDEYFAHLGGATPPAVVSVVRSLLPHDGVVFDVGSNIGLCTAAFAVFCPDGEVHSFEPGDRAFSDLLSTVDANGLTNVHLYHTAVGESDGTATLLVPTWNAAGAFMETTGGASAVHRASAQVTVTTVPVRSIDSVVTEVGLERLDVLKVDVEGYEDAVLAGAASTLDRFEPIVIVEFNAFTLSVFASRNPLDFLADMIERFPYVVAFDSVLRTEPVRSIAEAYSLVHRCFNSGQVVDLVGSWQPVADAWRVLAPEGPVAGS